MYLHHYSVCDSVTSKYVCIHIHTRIYPVTQAYQVGHDYVIRNPGPDLERRGEPGHLPRKSWSGAPNYQIIMAG